MGRNIGWITRLGVMLLVAALPHSYVFAGSETKTGDLSEVQDLHYGMVLYEFYQQNFYSAAVDLLTAQEQNKLAHHDEEAKLLLGGIYLSYGLHSDAEKIFQELLADRVSAEVRDRAWFYLGKIRYYKQLFREAEDALSKVGDSLEPTLQEELRTLKANLLMAQKKYPEAIASLSDLSEDDDDSQAFYARFNLGVAMIRAGRNEDGLDLLRQVGMLQSNKNDLKALRDKANLALGYLLIKTSPILAKDYFQRVRLNGPFSNRALLGMGWADTELQQYEQALVPWMELSKRDLVDIAVFESQLAIGNILERLRAYPQALAAYQKAIEVFQTELSTLEATQVAVQQGRLWDDLLAQVNRQGSRNEMGWFWEAELLPNTPEARYLKDLMASNGFHEAIKNLRDLEFLAQKLNRWQREIPAFEYMVTLRKETFESQQNKLSPQETLDRIVDVRTTRDILAEELRQIDESQNALALATEKEQDLLERLVRMEERLWKLSGHRDVEEYKDKYRFYKGLLEYDIQTTYAARHWKVEKLLNSLDKELEETKARSDSLQATRLEAPSRFEGFYGRIDAKRQRIESLQAEVTAAFEQQKRQLQLMVDAELEKLRIRLVDYLDQARFSLAHLQDLATNAPATASPSGGEQ